MTTLAAASDTAEAGAGGDALVVARGLVKRFGDATAVDGIDLEVRRGECFGLLGPNGAGKSSTIRMICCVSPITEGELTVDGLDAHTEARAIKSRIGVVPQEDSLDPDLSVEQNLRAYGRYFGLHRDLIESRIEGNLEFFQLADRRQSPIFALSGGLKRRLVIARALMNAPVMLVLDEPTTGLDPQARQTAWQKLRQLKARGLTLLLTTHYMDEAAQLCDRIMIMDHGKIVTAGRPEDLIARHAGSVVAEMRVGFDERDELVARLSGLGRYEVEAAGDTVHVFGSNGSNPAELAEEFGSRYTVTTRPANLEDVFLRLTGRSLGD